jgi:signal transduction histidine kinase
MYATVGCAPRVLVQIADDRVSTIPGTRLAASQCYKSHLVRDALGNTWYHTKSHVLQDARGNWWFHTPRGLEFSFGPQLRPQDTRLVGAADGFPESFYTEMYEDAGGNMWIVNGLSGNLYVADAQWEQRPRFRFVTGGLKNAEFLLHDRAGTLWIASSNRIWRLSHGKLLELQPSAGLPAIEPRAFFQDTDGRLWIGLRYHGVSMTTAPDVADPPFVNYTTADGLASDTVWSIAGDDDGHIYLGTGRGLDQLDVKTQRARHLTTETGVVGSVIEHLLKDRRGRIWIASDGGITQLDPRAGEAVNQPPPIFISAIQIAGQDWPLPVTGTQRVPSIELPSSRNTVAVQFVGLSYRSGNLLRYQYKLDDAGSDWSAPSERREVNFAGLSPGRYRFLVRAITSLDVPSAQPASVEFVILPPLYLRGWFIGLSALCLAGLMYAAYRYRVARLLEVANVRTRIATDLHDDIGANLTRIAILSEVARQKPVNGDENPDAPLASIASIARESVAAMSDIVWAITPDRDALHHLVRKMRNHAEEVVEAHDITLALNLPDGEQPLKLGVNVRRDLYLIFKEALNNAARHSRCSRLSIDFHLVGPRLCLEIVDDGVGFDQTGESDGHGLTSMKRRAVRLGATLEIASRSKQGTTVTLRMATARPRFGLRTGLPT